MRHGRSHARRLIFGPRMHTFCHPERKRGTSLMAVDHTSQIGLPGRGVGSLVVFATRDDVL